MLHDVGCCCKRLSPKISTELAFNMERTVQLSLQNGFNLVGCSEAVA